MQTGQYSRLVRMKEITDRLGVCRATVYNMIRAKEFPPPKKKGRSSFWLEEDILGKIAEITGDAAHARLQ